MADPLQNTINSTVSGATTGATLGGPWGAAIGGGIGLLSQLPSWFTANDQNNQANSLMNTPRPVYTIPTAETDALNQAKGLATQTRLPGQSAIEGRLDETTANKVSMLERMGMGGADAINGSSRAYGQQMDSENKLGEAAAANYNENQKNLINEQHTMAGFQDQAFQYNQADPYAEAVSYGRSLKGASIQNQNSFYNNIGGILANTSRALPWDKIFGGGGDGSPSVANNNNGKGYTATSTKGSMAMPDPNVFNSLFI